MAQKKISALTQATNAEQGDDDLVVIVIDPSGSPASRKTTLSRLGAPARSWLALVAAHSVAWPAIGAGSFSAGMKFCARRTGQTCTGVRFYWNGATARTVKATIWKGGAAQKTVDIAVNGAGYYTATFASAASLTTNEEWYVTAWEKSGTEYTVYQTAVPLPPRSAHLRDYVVLDPCVYAVGDAQPNTTPSTADTYPVEPVVTG